MSDTMSFENDWGTLNIGSNVGSGNNFFQLKDGENVIRIAGKPSMIRTHYEKSQDGKFKRIICLGDVCPICEAGGKPRTQYQCKVIDKSNWDSKTKEYDGDISVKIATLPQSVVKDINNYANDQDYGNPLNYDFKITKTGKLLSTSYSTVPRPKQELLTDEEKEAIKKCPNVQDVTKPNTIAEIKAMKLIILDGELMGDEQEQSKSTETQVKDSSWDDFD